MTTIPAPKAGLVVVTWNVLYRDIESRATMLADRLRAVDPDVVLLQETNRDHAVSLAAQVDMQLSAIPDAHGADARSLPAILVRDRPIRAGVEHVGTGAGRTCNYVYADLQVGSRVVRCATSHLQHTRLAGRMGVDEDYRRVSCGSAPVEEIRDAEIRESVKRRLEQLGAIEEVRAGLPDVDEELFGGDLNFVPRGPEYRRVLSWGLRDSWSDGPRLGSGATILEANPLIADGPDAYVAEASALRGSTGGLDYTLDFLFASAGMSADSAWTIGDGRANGEWPSDHLGIVVEYSLRGSN